MTQHSRSYGRGRDELRPVHIQPDPLEFPDGSALVEFGRTRVLCAATVQEGVPTFLEDSGQGWLTAEYSMLPQSTSTRTRRERGAGGVSGRTQEIQRLIGRSLRAAVRLEKLPGFTVLVDCDVLQADGGTRTAAITGGYVALTLAVRKRFERSWSEMLIPVAAVSAGIVDGETLLDLDYDEDSRATTDANIVKDALGRYIEVQGSAEHGSAFDRSQLDELLELADEGITELLGKQQEALGVG